MLDSNWGNRFKRNYTKPQLPNIIVGLLQSAILSLLFLIKHISLSLWELTIEAKTGRKSVAVATLLVHSVKVAISRHKMIAIPQGGIVCRGVIWSPNHFESPDTYRYIHNINIYMVKVSSGNVHNIYLYSWVNICSFTVRFVHCTQYHVKLTHWHDWMVMAETFFDNK